MRGSQRRFSVTYGSQILGKPRVTEPSDKLSTREVGPARGPDSGRNFIFA